MENYDRQQYGGGGDFGEVREDAFVGPSDGQEAVSEDAGQGDYWGGYPDRDTPQEQQQQEQGYVEGEYDPGFIPEGEYAPGSEYDFEGGYDPLFTWGGFEDDVVAEEPVEASAANPWGGTQPLETVGRADADAGNPEIEMYSEDARQAGVEAGVDENDIEMLPDDAGEAGTDAKDGGMQEIEFTPEEAAAIPAQPDDAGDGEIEMDPEYVGRSDWHKVADKFEEKFGEDELMLQMKFRQIAEDNPDLRVALKNVFGWEDTGRSDMQKVADKFEEKFGEDELKQHIEFRQALDDSPTLREVATNVFGYDHPGKDVEIEIPPKDVGQAGADTGVDENDIEMFPDDAGRPGADTGVDENDIEMLPGDGEIEMLP